jgi:hypothetical protein
MLDNSNQSDMEYDFEEQQKKPPTFFIYQNQNKSNTTAKAFLIKNEKIENTVYYVRIPVINPLNSQNLKIFKIDFFFYFKSYKPQEHWIKRGTEIYVNSLL